MIGHLFGVFDFTPVISTTRKPGWYSTKRRCGRRHSNRIFGVCAFAAWLLFAAGSTLAQDSPPTSGVIPQVPERLHYLFDLPWCKKWDLVCIRCEKKDGRIVCERIGESCGSFRQY